MNTYDAIIVGAGPAGSTTAILLAQAGWKVALVEKQRFPRRKVCGECIAATNMPLFELLGIADEFNELAGTDLRQVAVMLGKRTIIADMPALSNSDSPWGRALSRERLDSLLLQRARDTGAEILQPWAVKEIEGKVGDYQCDIAAVTCKETRHLKGRLIIAACGSWEPQPFMDHARVRNSSGDLFAFKANFQNSHLQPGLLPVLAFSGGYGGMVLEGSNNLTIACCVRRDALRACRAQFRRPTAGESVEAYLKASCSGVEHALHGAERQGGWLSVGPLRTGVRLGKTRQDFLLVGNAAAEAHPIIGEGLSMAMQSAWLLCESLVSRPEALQSLTKLQSVQQEYAEAWRKHFAPRMRLAALFAHIAMRPRLGSVLLPILQRWPGAITHSAHLSGKVKPLRLNPTLEGVHEHA